MARILVELVLVLALDIQAMLTTTVASVEINAKTPSIHKLLQIQQP